MTENVIIDGWNLAWKIPQVASLIPQNLPAARSKLHAIVNSHYARKKVTVKIIYDGQPGIINQDNRGRKIEVRFSKKPTEADSQIISFLRGQRKISSWTLITSDRELSVRAKNLGAGVQSSNAFSSRIQRHSEEDTAERKKQNPQLNPQEMNYWLSKFGTK